MCFDKRILLIAIIAFTAISNTFPQNPILQTIYTATPAPIVHNNRVYLYIRHGQDTATSFKMNDWHVYSSEDMVNWTHHGNPFSVQAFEWAGSDALAAHCIERNGKFYWYITITHKALNRPVVGVAVSDSPIGPFIDPIGQPLVAVQWSDIDAHATFIDDNGQDYLYWGNPGLWYIKLNEDMVSFDESIGVVAVPLMTEEFLIRKNDLKRSTTYEEGPWLYKRNGLYYLLYASGGIPEHIAYSSSESPSGPWINQGTIMHVVQKGGAIPNHPGIIDFQGRSFFFYHHGVIPEASGFNHSVCVEELTFSPDGTILKIQPTEEGVAKSVKNFNPYKRTEAETFAWAEGVKTESDDEGSVYVTDIQNGDYIKVRSVDFSKGPKSFKANVASGSKGGVIDIRLDSPSGPSIGICKVTNTGGWSKWKPVSAKISEVKGVHDLYFVFSGEEELFNFDWWQFVKK